MGHVAPLRRAPDYGWKLLRSLQQYASHSARQSTEPDNSYALRLIAEAIDNPATRDATLKALSEYLLQALSGCLPDLDQ